MSKMLLSLFNKLKNKSFEFFRNSLLISFLNTHRNKITYHFIYITFYTFLVKSLYLIYVYLYYFYFQTFFEFTERLAIIFLIVTLAYVMFNSLIPLHKLADFIVLNLLSFYSFLLFFVYTPFETHYYLLRGDVYEKYTFKDKVLNAIGYGFALYAVPVTCTVLDFHLGSVLWAFMMFLPYYISRIYDLSPLTPLVNIEFLRELIDNDISQKESSIKGLRKIDEHLFSNERFTSLPSSIKEVYINLFNSLNKNSIFFPTFLFYLYLFNRYDSYNLISLFNTGTLNRFNCFFSSNSLKTYVYGAQPFSGKFASDAPLCDREFLLSGGIISAKTYLLRQVISGTVAVGSGAILTEQYFKRSKQLQDDKFNHEEKMFDKKAFERQKERDHEVLMKRMDIDNKPKSWFSWNSPNFNKNKSSLYSSYKERPISGSLLEKNNKATKVGSSSSIDDSLLD